MPGGAADGILMYTCGTVSSCVRVCVRARARVDVVNCLNNVYEPSHPWAPTG